MKRKILSRLTRAGLLLTVAFAIAPVSVSAAPRALLIGLGNYSIDRFNLDGIDLDINIMHNVAARLGYTSDQIMTLEDEQVTRENLTRVFSTWLREGVTANDKVLIYYSGHGFQLEDTDNYDQEADGYDEALTLYETGTEGAKDNGMLRDDDLAELIKSIPSNNIALVVDACCSGTASKSLSFGNQQLEFTPKSIPGCPSNSAKSLPGDDGFNDKGFGVQAARSGQSVVYLSAAQDNEEALASSKGSIFTLALKAAIDSDRNYSPEEIKQFTTRYIAQRISDDKVFRPNLTGDKNRLAQKALYVVENQQQQPVERNRWGDIVNQAAGSPIRILRDRQSGYRFGETIPLTIQMPFDGYLSIVAVDADDRAKLMYPNKHAPESRLEAAGSPVTFPTHQFQWVASEPAGENRYIVLATRSPLNLYGQSHDFKNGEALDDFLSLSPSSSQALSDGKSAADYQAGQVVFQTCSSGCD